MNKWVNFAAPSACALLLLGMTTLDKLRLDPREADGFHARAASAVAKVPHDAGSWMFHLDRPLPDDAGDMLRPNAYLDRVYYKPSARQDAELLIVQCRDIRHMQGHYPPVCYPSVGCKIPASSTGTWQAGALRIPGTEYDVRWPDGSRRMIRNFFVLPNGKIVPDMESVTRAAKNYRAVVYGVAQIQLLMDPSVGADDRNQIFNTLVGANAALIDVLRSGGIE